MSSRKYAKVFHPDFDFEDKMKSILCSDDVEKFHNYIGKGENALPLCCYPAILDLCLEEGAKECTLYMLQGKLPHGSPQLDHQTVAPDGRSVPALFIAIDRMAYPDVIEILLNKCGANFHANQDFDGLLPLDFLLGYIEKPVDWSLEQSLLKLILLLILLPRVRSKLECARLLAEYTDSVNEVALRCIHHGEIIQLAALLLVARERAMAPFGSGETIKEHIGMENITEQVISGGSAARSIAAAGLIEIFEKAGDELTTCFELEPTDALKVTVEIAEIIHKAGMQVVNKNVVFNFRLRILRSISGMLGIEMDDSDGFQMGNRSPTRWLKVIDKELSPINHSVPEVVYLQNQKLLRGGRYNCVPSNNLGPRTFSTTAQIIDNSALRNILSQDDVDKFCEYFSKEADLSSYHYPTLLHSCLEKKAKNCALYLLKGGSSCSLPCVHEEIVPSKVELSPVFSAICNMCDPEVVDHLIKYCGDHHVNQTFMGILPLHFVLNHLVGFDPLSMWCLGQSLAKLILLLFAQHDAKPTLASARCLAKYTNSLDEVALGFIQRGELIQLAGLLLVTHERAMDPLISETIKLATSKENIVSQVISGESVAATTGTVGLLEIFEKAGDALAAYYWSIPKDEPAEEVIVQVAKILKNAKISLICTDVDLTDTYSSSIQPCVLRSVCERLDIEMDGTSRKTQMRKKPMFPSLKAVEEKWRQTHGLNITPLEHAVHNGVWPGCGIRTFSTYSQVVDKISTRNCRHSWGCPSGTDMAYLVMKIKRRIRLH